MMKKIQIGAQAQGDLKQGREKPRYKSQLCQKYKIKLPGCT